MFFYVDTIVNATSSWPLNSLNSSVLPTYEESIAANHSTYLPYFDREPYTNFSKNPSKERNFNMIDNVPRAKKSVPMTREEYSMDMSYRPRQIFDNQTFNEEYTPRVENIPYSNRNVVSTEISFTTGSPSTAKEKLLSIPNPETTTLYKPSAHTSTDIVPKTTEIPRSDVHAEEDKDSQEPKDFRTNYDNQPSKTPSDVKAESKPEEISIKEEPESSTGSPQDRLSPGVKMAEDVPTFSSPPVQNSNDTFDHKSPDTVDIKKEADDVNEMYSFLDWKDGIATLPGLPINLILKWGCFDWASLLVEKAITILN